MAFGEAGDGVGWQLYPVSATIEAYSPFKETTIMHKAQPHKTEFIRARIEPNLKAAAHAVFAELGVTPTQVITMLYKQVQNKHALPFDLSVPNAETARAIKEARNRKGLIACKDAKDMFKKLGR